MKLNLPKPKGEVITMECDDCGLEVNSFEYEIHLEEHEM